MDPISGKAEFAQFKKPSSYNLENIRAGRCWASTEVSRHLAKNTTTKESTMEELLAGDLEETLMTETTIDGEVMKESIIGEVGGGRRRSTRSTTKAIEAAAGEVGQMRTEV